MSAPSASPFSFGPEPASAPFFAPISPVSDMFGQPIGWCIVNVCRNLRHGSYGSYCSVHSDLYYLGEIADLQAKEQVRTAEQKQMMSLIAEQKAMINEHKKLLIGLSIKWSVQSHHLKAIDQKIEAHDTEIAVNSAIISDHHRKIVRESIKGKSVSTFEDVMNDHREKYLSGRREQRQQAVDKRRKE